MAILSRPRLLAQQRLDLEDWEVLLSSLCADAKFWTREFWGDTQFVLKGFEVSGLGGSSPALITLDGATLINANNSGDFSWFVGETGASALEATLNPGQRNYLELELKTETGTPLTRAFWDPSAQGGLGAEFNQNINTVTNLAIDVVVLTGGFSGSSDRVPIAIVDADGSNNITGIFDRRNMFFRLGTPTDAEAEYAWGSRGEPELTLNLTGISGTFQVGETVNIGSAPETAEVQTVGGSSIGVILPSGDNISKGDSVTGQTSGASATLDSFTDTFTGADKSIDSLREAFRAIETEIKKIKGTRFWPTIGVGSITGLNNFINSTLAENPGSSGPRFVWDGSNLQIRDDNSTPSDTDVIAYTRFFKNSDNYELTRQEDGLEVQTITFDAVPDSGSFSVDFNGTDSNSVNYDEDASDFQSAWDANISESVTITGNFKDGFEVKFDTLGDKSAITITTNSLTKDGNAVNITITETKKGQSTDSSIPIADQEILFIKIPSSGDRTYDGVGSSDTNYQKTSLGSFVNNDENYWLAYREGAKLYTRHNGTLSAGEATLIQNNGVSETLLASIGVASENSPPSYSSNIRGSQNESLVDRASILTDSTGDYQEDRSAFIRSDEIVTWTGSELQFNQDIVIEVINTKDGTLTQHTIPAAQSPIALNDGESAWVQIDRGVASETLTVNNSGSTPIPAQDQFNKDTFVLFRRKDAAGGLQVLHIPFHKQALEPGQTVRLGASGAGGGGTNLFSVALVNRLNDSIFEAVTPYIATEDEDDTNLVDAGSTGAFDPVTSRFKLTNIGDTLVSANLLDATFLGGSKGIDAVEAIIKYDSSGNDTGATYELSRNGGNEWQDVTSKVERVDDAFTYRVFHEFDQEASNQTLNEYAVGNADSTEVLTNTVERVGQIFTVSNLAVLRDIELYLSKTGTPGGNYYISIIKDDAGSPSTDPTDIVYESSFQPVSSLSAGNNTINLSAELVLGAGDYHIVVSTDQTYKDNFSSGVDEIAVRTDASTPSITDLQTFSSGSWSAVAGEAMTYKLDGIELDLRLRVTSSVTDALIEGFGVLYEENLGNLAIATTVEGITKVSFKAVADNTNSFTLPFLPNADLLQVHLLGSGQTFRFGDFALQGNTVVFPQDQFNNAGVEKTQTLIFDQVRGGAFDNSDVNGALLAANNLGSTDGSLDKSSAGRGIFLRRPDGTLREITIDNNDNIAIYSV